MISIWSLAMVSGASNKRSRELKYQSAPRSMVSEHSFPSFAKSAERIDGAMNGRGAIVVCKRVRRKCPEYLGSLGYHVAARAKDIGSLTFILARQKRVRKILC